MYDTTEASETSFALKSRQLRVLCDNGRNRSLCFIAIISSRQISLFNSKIQTRDNFLSIHYDTVSQNTFD